MVQIPLVLLGILGVTASRLPYRVDVLFLQDRTTSMRQYLPTLSTALPEVVRELEECVSHDCETWTGLADFGDKPYSPFGQPVVDYCYRLITGLAFETNPDWLAAAYRAVQSFGGGDPLNAQFQAMITAAYDPLVVWRKPDLSIWPNAVANRRMLVLVTDSYSHKDGDFKPNETPEATQPPAFTLPANLTLPTVPGLQIPLSPPPNSGRYSVLGSPNFECLLQDYPSPTQAAAALREQEIALGVLVIGGDSHVTSQWKEFVRSHLSGQSAEYSVKAVHDCETDLRGAFFEIVNHLTERKCGEGPAPTRSPAATQTVQASERETTTSTIGLSSGPATTVATITASPSPSATASPTVTVAPTVTVSPTTVTASPTTATVSPTASPSLTVRPSSGAPITTASTMSPSSTLRQTTSSVGDVSVNPVGTLQTAEEEYTTEECDEETSLMGDETTQSVGRVTTQPHQTGEGETTEEGCPIYDGGCNDECKAALVIKVNDSPKFLDIKYQK